MILLDSHIHSEGRSVEDLRNMSDAGIKYAITCAFYPIQPLYPETLIDLFRKLVDYESERGNRAGMKIYASVGIHPRCIPPKWDKVVDFMEHDYGWIAFGEIGLEKADKVEKDVLRSQLKLAKKLDMPCIIHTPRKNKEVITEKIFEILERVEFPESLCLIDHIDNRIIGKVIERDYIAGLTVQPGKLNIDDAAKLVLEFGDERFIANSDTGFSESDMLAVAKLAEKINSENVLLKNGFKFFRIK